MQVRSEQMRTGAAVLGLLGGFCWLLAAGLGWGEDPLAGAARAVSLTGVALVLVSGAMAGYAVAPTAPLWLRVVVMAGSMTLTAVVLAAVMPEYEAGAGLFVLLGVLTLLVSAAAGRSALAHQAAVAGAPEAPSLPRPGGRRRR